MHVNDGIALNHLDRMTDSTGLIQHAIYSIPGARAATRPTTTPGPCASARACGIGSRGIACSAG